MRRRAKTDPRLERLALTPAEAEALSGMVTVIEVPTGTVLCREGSRSRQLVWLVDGIADIFRRGDRIARVGAGDVVGEGTMLGAHDLCSADVVAETPLTVAVLSRQEWWAAAERAPTLVNRLFEVALDREPALAA